MTTRCKSFEGAITTADTDTTINTKEGNATYTPPKGVSKIVAIIAAIGDEAVQEPYDATIMLTLDDNKGPFEYPISQGGAPASSVGFVLNPPTIIPVDIEVTGGSTTITVEARSSGTPESVRVGLVFE